MATWIGGPVLDPLGAAIGAGLGQGIGKYYDQQTKKSDLNTWLDYLKQMQQMQQQQAFMPTAQAASDWLGDTSGFIGAPELSRPGPTLGMPEVPMPQFKRSDSLQAFLQWKLGQTPSLMDQTMMGKYSAEADESRARAANYLRQAMAPVEYEKTDPRYYTSQGYALPDAWKAARTYAQLEVTPVEQAQIESQKAGAERDRAYTDQLRQPPIESPTDLKAREMKRLDIQLRVLEEAGKQNTPEYRDLQKRRDEQYGYDVSGFTPAQQLVQMKLDEISKLDKNSYEFKQALGLGPQEPVPEGLYEDLTDALQTIQLGADPIKVYQEMFRANPQFITQVPGIRQILLADQDPFAQFFQRWPK